LTFFKEIIISFLDTAEKPTHDPKPKRLPTRPKYGLGRKKTSELGPARTSLTSSDSKQRRTRKFCDQQGIKVNIMGNDHEIKIAILHEIKIAIFHEIESFA
jgi:hypothetical protein